MQDTVRIVAKDIETLLSIKHKEDVFVSQCKTGRTWGNNSLAIMDGWVMKKSYSNPLMVGYEIKISRSNFLKDNKWPQYLDYCNEFYFICPWKLISVNEVPPEVGLIYVNKKGNKLYTKKRAQYRDVPEPVELYVYILMSRCQIVSEWGFDNKGYWERWMKESDEKKDLGHSVSKKIRQIIEERIDNKEYENKKLKAENKKLNEIKEFLERNNLKYDQWNILDEIKEKLITGIPKELKNRISFLEQDLRELREYLEEMSR